jgi:hypothetical protein
VGPRLVSLAALLARRQGAAAAQSLLQSGRAWMADPANDATKQALLVKLRDYAEHAGGTVGQVSSKLARDVEKRRVSVAAWERDLMAMRYEVVDMAPGPVREAALDAYVAQATAGVHLIASASKKQEARVGVIRALDAEAKMVRTERLSADERGRALDALAAARAVCAGNAA